MILSPCIASQSEMSSYLPSFVWPLLAEFDAWSSARLADPSTHWALVWLLSLSLLQATALTMAIFALLIGTKRVLRWPVLVCIFLFLVAELCVYFSVRYVVYLLESFVFLTSSARAARPLRSDMKDAKSYSQWARLAAKADESLGTAAWKAEPQSRYFNGPLLKTLMDELRAAREKHDIGRLTATLQTCLHKVRTPQEQTGLRAPALLLVDCSALAPALTCVFLSLLSLSPCAAPPEHMRHPERAAVLQDAGGHQILDR